jgi:beta-lactamase regulating signal transducer with metallopeptidase domain
MRGFLIALMECSVTMSVLALCFIALTPWLSKKYATKWLYYGWLVIVIGLIIPFRLHPDTPLIHKDLFVNTVAVQQMEYNGSDMMEQSQNQADTQNFLGGNPRKVSDDQKPVSGIIWQILHSPWYMWAGALWVFGAVLFIALHGIRHRRFLQMIRRWSQEVTNQQTLDILQSQKVGLGISKQVAIRTCSCVSSPMMIGIIKPVVLLPEENYSVSTLSLFFNHELVHLKRRDLWYKILVLVATAIHWFNPVVYLMAKAIAVQCEISCDMEVMKNAEMDKRQEYSEIILNVVKNNRRMQTVFSTNFYGGKKEMKNRIFLIMDGTKKKTGIFILCAALILTLGSGVVFAAGSDNTEDLRPLTARGGAITIYYNSFHTLEANVLTTLGKPVLVLGSKIQIKHLPSPDYIDVNGRQIDIYNRTEPYYSVKWNWMAKDSEAKNFAQKTLTIKGKEVTVAFSDKAAAYKNDKVIEKMVTNIISFASVYKDKTYNYDYKAFIDELISRGILVIQEVTVPENFGWNYTTTKITTEDGTFKDIGFLARKVLTKYDSKEKITSVYNGRIIVPENIDGNQGVQVGDSFTIGAGATLAIDIKELTDDMPQVNWAIVDVTTGETVDWMPGARQGQRFVWTPSDNYVNNTFRVMASTCKPSSVNDNAVLEIFTYKTGQQEMPDSE